MANEEVRCSFRLSPEVYALLVEQPGNTLTGKFEHLIRTAYDLVPEAQKQLKDITTQIENERKHLRVLRDQKSTLAQNVNSVNYALKALVSTVERANANIENSGVLK